MGGDDPMSERVLVAYTRALKGMIDRTVECFELLDELRELEVQLAAVTQYRDKVIVANEQLVAENRILRVELELERSRYTLGGIPPESNAPVWTNVAAPPVSSASDDTAPPLRRSETSSSYPGGAE